MGERYQEPFSYLVNQWHIQEGDLNGNKKEQENTEVEKSRP